MPSVHFLDRVIPIFTVLHHLKTSVAYVIQVKPPRVNIYLALKNDDTLPISLKVIEKALGAENTSFSFKILDANLSSHLLRESLLSSSKNSSLSALTLNLETCNTFAETNSSKLSTLFQYMEKEAFTLLFLADFAEPSALQETIYQFENLFTLLDSFRETTFTYHKTFSENCSHTLSDTKFQSMLHTASETDKKDVFKGHHMKNIDSLILNIKVDDTFNYIINSQPATEKECKEILSHSDSQTTTKQNHLTDATSKNDSTSKGHNSTYNFKGENKTAIELLKRVDALLSSLYAIQHLPSFNFGIYVLSEHAHTTLLAACTYLELLRNAKHSQQENYMTTWYKEEKNFNPIMASLQGLSHPLFIKGHNRSFCTPTTWIEAKCLAQLLVSPQLPHDLIKG